MPTGRGVELTPVATAAATSDGIDGDEDMADRAGSVRRRRRGAGLAEEVLASRAGTTGTARDSVRRSAAQSGSDEHDRVAGDLVGILAGARTWSYAAATAPCTTVAASVGGSTPSRPMMASSSAVNGSITCTTHARNGSLCCAWTYARTRSTEGSARRPIYAATNRSSRSSGSEEPVGASSSTPATQAPRTCVRTLGAQVVGSTRSRRTSRLSRPAGALGELGQRQRLDRLRGDQLELRHRAAWRGRGASGVRPRSAHRSSAHPSG